MRQYMRRGTKTRCTYLCQYIERTDLFITAELGRTVLYIVNLDYEAHTRANPATRHGIAVPKHYEMKTVLINETITRVCEDHQSSYGVAAPPPLPSAIVRQSKHSFELISIQLITTDANL